MAANGGYTADMDENPAIRELDLAALLVRLTWIAVGLYFVVQIANQVRIYNIAMRAERSMGEASANMLGMASTSLSAISASLVSVLAHCIGMIIAAYATRTLIWIAVRHGAVPGQIMPDDAGA